MYFIWDDDKCKNQKSNGTIEEYLETRSATARKKTQHKHKHPPVETNVDSKMIGSIRLLSRVDCQHQRSEGHGVMIPYL